MGWDCRGSALPFAVALTISLLVIGSAEAEQRQGTRERSISAIEELGGEVIRDEGVPDAVIEASLSGPHVTDAALTYLTPLIELRRLDLSAARITDSGLENLKELKKLQRLDLSDTPINGT